jgi:hypothetical protein
MMDALPTPKSRDSADQCREMGIKVGDVIEGREGAGDWWSESRLTLLFLGAEVAVFSEQRRSSERLEWQDDGESGHWTLICRAWRKVGSA